MVNPGAFRGVRKEFLLGEKKDYAVAVLGGYQKDALAIIQRRYLKRFPLDLPHDEDPSQDDLDTIDDDEPEPEPEQPDEENLSPEEYQEAVKQVQDRRELLRVRKGQINRWMSYQYMKDNDNESGDSGNINTHRLLLHKLVGVSALRPRYQAPANFWRKDNRDVIEAETLRRAEVAGVTKKRFAPIREKVVKELFVALEPEEKADWTKIAKEDHDEALAKWEAKSKGPASTTPEDRQRAIQGLTHFMQQVLDLVVEHTGWKASFVAGGPEPAHEGRLNVISIHSGTTSGDIKMNFGRAEQAKYRESFLPIFGNFLRKCYTPEECRSRALPSGDSFERVSHLDLGEVDIVSLDDTDNANTPLANADLTISNNPPIIAVQSELPTNTNPIATLNVLPADTPPSETNPSSISEGLVDTPRAPFDASRPAEHVPPTPDLLPSMELAKSPQNTSLPPSPLCSPPLSRHPSPKPAPHPQDVTPTPHLESDRPSLGKSPSPVVQTQLEDVECSTSTSLKRKLNESISADEHHTTESSIAKRTRHSTLQIATTSPPTAPTFPKPKPQARPKHGRKRNDVPPSNVSQPQSPINSSSIPDLKTAPEWFASSFKSFTSADFGVAWKGLLRDWMVFEAASQYAEVSKLKTKSRPALIQWWIARARSTVWRPLIDDLDAYEDQFEKWWIAIQPSWRVVDGCIDQSLARGDWECIRLPGLNGLHSVIAALFYWGLALGMKLSSSRRWLAAVEDCRFVINQFAA